MGGACRTHGKMRNACRFLSKNLKDRPMGRWEHNIEIELKEVECVWTGSVWLRTGNGL